MKISYDAFPEDMYPGMTAQKASLLRQKLIDEIARNRAQSDRVHAQNEQAVNNHLNPNNQPSTIEDIIMQERRAAGVFVEPATNVATNVEPPHAPRAKNHGSRADDRQVGGMHYKNMDVSPWDVVDTWPREQRIGAYRAGALKYIMRMGSKDESTQEIAKGIHYLEKLLDTLKEPS